jgi:hypothetical protein
MGERGGVATLRDIADTRAKILDTDACNVDAVDRDRSAGRVGKAKKGEGKRRLREGEVVIMQSR